MAETSSGGDPSAGGTDSGNSNLRRFLRQLSPSAMGAEADRRKRTRNIVIFSGTMGVALIVLVVSLLLANENAYNRRAKVFILFYIFFMYCG